jgi:hypothetical protein
MVWVPPFNAVQEEGVIDNILFIVERDFKLALDVYHPIEAVLPETDPRFLRDFQEREWGGISGLVFPALSVGPNRSASTLSDGGDRLRGAIEFSSWIGVTDDSRQTVGRRITRYANTYEMVLRKAALKNKADFLRNMSVQSFGLVLDEVEKFYGAAGEKESIFFQYVRVNGTLIINER